MVNINTVYQTVLTLANKEQRGYITPQEFNLYATQAQMSIFEQYFYDLNQFLRVPGNDTPHADMVDMLEEKIALFRKTNRVVGGGTNLPDDLYKLEIVQWKDPSTNKFYTAERINQKEWEDIKNTSLLAPTDQRLAYIRNQNRIAVQGKSSKTTNVTCSYIFAPSNPNWTYAVINEKALYNPNATDHNHFELHESEQTELVVRILGLAGITLKDPNLYQIASTEESKQIQNQKR